MARRQGVTRQARELWIEKDDYIKGEFKSADGWLLTILDMDEDNVFGPDVV